MAGVKEYSSQSSGVRQQTPTRAMSVCQEGGAVLGRGCDSYVHVLLARCGRHQIFLLIILNGLAQALDAPLVPHLLAAAVNRLG